MALAAATAPEDWLLETRSYPSVDEGEEALDARLDAALRFFAGDRGEEAETWHDRAINATKWALEVAGMRPEMRLWNVKRVRERFKYLNFNITGLETAFLLLWSRRPSVADAEQKLAECRRNVLLKKLSYLRQMQRSLWDLTKAVNDIHDLQAEDGTARFADARVPPQHFHSDFEARLANLQVVNGKTVDEVERIPDFQSVVDYVLTKACEKRYRRRGDLVYEERRVTWGGRDYGTRAWIPADFGSQQDGTDSSCIKALIYCLCGKTENKEKWASLLNTRAKDVAKVLEECEEHLFPRLRPQRNALSFRNGIYITDYEGVGAFFGYDTDGYLELNPDVVATKFFDQEFRYEDLDVAAAHPGAWWHISTPVFQSILDYQQWGCPLAELRGVEEGGTISKGERCATTLRRVVEKMNLELDDGIHELRATPAADVPALYKRIVLDATAKIRALKYDEPTSPGATETRDDPTSPGATETREETTSPGATEARETREAREETTFPGATETREEPSSRPPPPQDRGASRLPLEAQRFVYVFMGRMLHELNKHDRWQIIPFFKGRGGSGKSTVGQIVKNFFQPQDVGLLSSNCERVFALQSLCRKFVWLCLELKKSISLNQAEFQSMVSGEDMSVAQKGQATRQETWTSPGMLCGNEAPGYIDAQGSIARRMAVITFPFSVSERDARPNLLCEILEQELPSLIAKCNTAYLETCRFHPNEDIWKILPPYFKSERLRFQRDTCPVYSVVYDESLYERYDPKTRERKEDFYVLKDDFEAKYVQRWKDTRGGTHPELLTPEKWGQCFSEAGLKVVFDTRVWQSVTRNADFIIGLRPRLATAPVLE